MDQRARLISPDNIFMRYNFACIMALQFEDADAALDLLEPLFPQLSASAYKAVSTDPDLDSLRNHRRFVDLMAQASERLKPALAPSAAK